MRRRRRSKREIPDAVPFAGGEEAAAATVLRGKSRSDESSTEEDAAAFRQGKRRSRSKRRETVSPLHLGHLMMPFSSGSIETKIQIDLTRARPCLNQAAGWASPG